MTVPETRRTGIVRVFREAKGKRRLLLHDGERLLDLSAYLVDRGQPTDLVELAESGWFDGAQLAQHLPEGTDDEDWTVVPGPWDSNAPEGVGTPIPAASVGKILALGKNFREHAAEFGEAVPEEPLFFDKLPETLSAHRAEVVVRPWYDGRVDHEAELCVVVGLGGRDIAVEDALEHVAGYTVANDLTARSLQGSDRKQQYPWFRSKNMDGFCPLGPCFVPRDFFDLSDAEVTATVNGEVRQRASTRDLVVDVPNAIAWLSRHLTLHPGDLILMGTPAGVGPLVDGDRVVCSVGGIGALETTLRRPTT